VGWLARTAWLTLTWHASSPRRRDQWTHGAAPALLAIVVLVGAIIVVAIAIGVASAAAWVAFGISIATAAAGIALAVVARLQRRRVLAWFGALIAGLAGWTVIATTGLFSEAVARWIAFGSGIGYIVAALGALGVHELSPPRMVHVLEVRGEPRAARS
jgi:predicted membrane channel-forming protein YqfA (hemolysin III family)